MKSKLHRTFLPILLYSSFLFAEDPISCRSCSFAQGDETFPVCPPCYNPPANFALQCATDLFFDASYIYWLATQKGMDLASSEALASNSPPSVVLSDQISTLYQGGNFSSGFKIGLGGNVNRDQTILYAQYTYYRQNKHISSSALQSNQGTGTWYMTSWFAQTTPGHSQELAASFISSHWHLGIDWVDVLLKSPFYESSLFIVDLFGGVRGSWIRQKLKLEATAANTTPPDQPTLSNNHSTNWGLGPRIGFDLSWLIGKGFKFFGELATELLYTQSTNHHSETPFSNLSGWNYPVKFSNDIKTMRFSTDTQMGFAWGSYLSDHRYHLNFDVCYELNFLSQENSMRNLIDVTVLGSGASLGDLFLQGVTASGRFDF